MDAFGYYRVTGPLHKNNLLTENVRSHQVPLVAFLLQTFFLLSE